MPCLPATNHDHVCPFQTEEMQLHTGIASYKHPVLNPWIHHLIFFILISFLENNSYYNIIISNNYGQYLLLLMFSISHEHESFNVFFYSFPNNDMVVLLLQLIWI